MNYIKRLLPALVVLFVFSAASATVRTVNNAITPINPGQYSTIAAAIAAASNGDTILVAGSIFPYDAATITLNKRLVLIGAGYNPKGATQSTKVAQIINITCLGSGSTLMGFEFALPVTFVTGGGTNHSNITFLRNYFKSPCGFAADSTFDIKFINNIYQSGVYNSYSASVYVRNVYYYNNIFLNCCASIYSINLYSGVNQSLVLDHNLFLYGSQSSTLLAATSAIGAIRFNSSGTGAATLITNNIFYNTQPLQTATGYTGYCVYVNNYVYGSGAMPTLPYHGGQVQVM